MGRLQNAIVTVFVSGLTAYAGYHVLGMFVDWRPPETATERDLLAGIEQSLSMLTPSSTAAILLVVGLLGYFTVYR